MIKVEKNIIEFIEKNIDKIVLGFILLAAIYMRCKYTPLIDITNGGSDYKSELVPWVDYFREHGFKEGLVSGYDDYYVPYMVFLGFTSFFNIPPYWFIACFSYIFDFIMAFYLYKLILLVAMDDSKNNISKGLAACIAASSLLLPMVMANSAIWKQCDSIYVAIVLAAVYYLLKKKYTLSFILTGIAFSFKLQTIMAFPFLLIAYYVLKEFSALQFLWIPFMYAVTGLPAILCGKRITRTYGVYFRQMDQYGAMTVNSPGIYNIGMSEYMYHHVATFATITILAFTVLLITIKKPQWNKVKFIYLLGWTAMTCFEFLPSMHERYDYLAIIVLTLVAVCYRRKIIPAVLVMHLVSACTYGKFLFSYNVHYVAVSVDYLMAYAWVTYDFICCMKEPQNL